MVPLCVTLGSTWWRCMKFPDMYQKSFTVSPASGSESRGCGRDPSDSSRKSVLLSPWIGRCRTKVDVLRSWSPPGVLIRPSAIGKINSPSLGNVTSFALSLFEWIYDASIVSNSSGSETCTSPVQILPRVQSVSKEQSRWDFLSKLMDSWLVLRSSWVTLNQWTKWNNRSLKWLPKTSFTGRLPIRQQVCDVSQMGIAFHRICPPTFI